MSSEPAAPETPAILDSIWAATSIKDNAVLPRTKLSLSIGEDLRAGGSGGCNSWFAQAQVTGDALQLGSITSTMKACTQSVNLQEQAFKDALAAVATLESRRRCAHSVWRRRQRLCYRSNDERYPKPARPDCWMSSSSTSPRGRGPASSAATSCSAPRSCANPTCRWSSPRPTTRPRTRSGTAKFTPSSASTNCPPGTRPAPKDCLFLATHEPCSLCLSRHHLGGLRQFLFPVQPSGVRRQLRHPLRHPDPEGRLCRSRSGPRRRRARSRLYNRNNAYFTSHDMSHMIGGLDRGAKERLTARVDDLTALYADLSAIYQRDKGRKGIPLSSARSSTSRDGRFRENGMIHDNLRALVSRAPSTSGLRQGESFASYASLLERWSGSLPDSSSVASAPRRRRSTTDPQLTGNLCRRPRAASPSAPSRCPSAPRQRGPSCRPSRPRADSRPSSPRPLIERQPKR